MQLIIQKLQQNNFRNPAIIRIHIFLTHIVYMLKTYRENIKENKKMLQFNIKEMIIIPLDLLNKLQVHTAISLTPNK